MTEQQTVRNIPIADIHIDDEFNCRGTFAPIDVSNLAADIKANGLHQPVVVMPYSPDEQIQTGYKFKLVAGFRRTYAHKVLNLPTVLCLIKEHMTDLKARLINLSENLKRKDLNIMQESMALKALKDNGLNEGQIAEYVGKSKGWVTARTYLLSFPIDIQKEAAAGMINQYQIRKLHELKTTEQQYDMVRKIKDARARGEKTDKFVKRTKPKPHMRKKRTPHEVLEMMGIMMDQIGASFATRCMAWCAGEINDLELYQAISEEYPEFKAPHEVQE